MRLYRSKMGQNLHTYMEGFAETFIHLIHYAGLVVYSNTSSTTSRRIYDHIMSYTLSLVAI